MYPSSFPCPGLYFTLGSKYLGNPVNIVGSIHKAATTTYPIPLLQRRFHTSFDFKLKCNKRVLYIVLPK